MASVIPGHTRLPAPNGIIFISLVPVRSTLSPSPPGMKRSGEKDIGLDQTSGFLLILPTRKFTVVPPRGRRDTPSALAAFVSIDMAHHEWDSGVAPDGFPARRL
ncbi:hypothetical protein PR202_gb13505 [Eleusine coracana subsp. coracana]|uniref:Uncharacterized protein n=1 Tax=Eleusine coracana subsp. coracana TaxID=191504 RepID=A0AAV5ETY3_ELECO|nr:hypothetical protein PR202_gb13505 [Eleusine coracana subsp. coracana]